MPFGEAFELSAFNADREAAAFPSQLRFDDGSRLALPELLEAQGEALLGRRFLRRHGACFPLLPKTLSVRELLSVQGHPAGNTEVYVIIDAEPGATLRLGFRRDIDAGEMARMLGRGLQRQQDLLRLLGPGFPVDSLQSVLAPWFAAREAVDDALRLHFAQATVSPRACDQAMLLLAELKEIYWHVLDSMNEIEVSAGQVIYNATPERLLTTGQLPSAEVHALGNPEGREILALEIRRPGPTFRAWDNVRFPQREVDVEAALAALNLQATLPEEYLCEKSPMPGRERSFASVDCEFFRVEHLLSQAGHPVEVPAAGPHTLHCLSGSAEVFGAAGTSIGVLQQGESALVPVGIRSYRIESREPAEIIRVVLPESE
jgi:mannose-6-phosphate isomerase class I